MNSTEYANILVERQGPVGIIMLGWSTAYLVSLIAQMRLLSHDWLTLDEGKRREQT